MSLTPLAFVSWNFWPAFELHVSKLPRAKSLRVAVNDGDERVWTLNDDRQPVKLTCGSPVSR